MDTKPITQKHPLAEVFGFKPNIFSSQATRYRQETLCPFNNIESRCTKDKRDKPLGVCSINHNDKTTIICPIRFREDWKICEDAADFFFPSDVLWTPVKEVRLKDANGLAAGNIDIVMIAHTKDRKILDFGALEVQAVYVSGNIRKPFEHYMSNPKKNHDMDWTNKDHYPKPDYLSSSRKRLGPQLMYKGQIFKAWGKKQAVVVDKPFFDTLPVLTPCSVDVADLCWLIYQMNDNKKLGRYTISLNQRLLTGFGPTMKTLNNPEIGKAEDFIESLDKKLAVELDELKRVHNVSALSELLKKNKSINHRQKIDGEVTL